METKTTPANWKRISDTRFNHKNGAAVICKEDGWWLYPDNKSEQGPFRYAELAMNTPMIGDTVGYYWLKEPYVHPDTSFETASWWEDTTLKPGIYPLKVGVRSYGRDKPLFLYADGIGTVTDAYFPLGGVTVGGSNSEQHIGKKKAVRIGVEVGQTICRTGNSPSPKGPDVWVDPKFWEGFALYARERLKNTIAYFEPLLLGSSYDRPELEQARNIKIRSQWIAEDAELVEILRWQIEQHEKTTPMRTENFEKNTAWAHADHVLTLIEQPHTITEDSWFVQTCITGGGAVGGAHIKREEIERRLTEKCGAGELVEIDQKWYWKTPRENQDSK